MLLRAARSPCWRPARFAHPSFADRAPWTRPNSTQLRIFTSFGRMQDQSTDGKDPMAVKPGSTAVPTPADGNAPQPKEVAKKDLLSESTKATQEQRKADWAIMREMAKYLWPKVWPIVFTAGIGSTDRVCRTTGALSFVLDLRCHC